MALSKDLLKSLLLKAFSDIKRNPGSNSLPLISQEVAMKLALAYDQYAKLANAGPLLPATPGNITGLASQLSSLPLFSGWGPGLVLYWTPVMFSGPGFIPVNPTVAAGASVASAQIASYLSPIISSIGSSKQTEDQFLESLSSILHSATQTVIVTATTTTAPPVVSTIPVS